MKKTIPFSVLLFLSLVSTAFARDYRESYRHAHTPAPQPVAPSTPPVQITTQPIGSSTQNGLQFGFFEAPAGVSAPWTMAFTDGAFPSFSGNAVIFMEPPYDDAQIVAGDFDSQLRSFAQAAFEHSGTVILPLGEEVNCDNSDPWGGAYKGNTVASTIAAFQHEATLAREYDPNILIAFSTNNGSCYGEAPATSFYPGAAYVNIVGDDGFDFGGQNWAQVFDSSLTSLAALGKPMWILSEGIIPTDNQSQFISDTFLGAKTYNLQGVLYFNGPGWTLSSAVLSTLKTLMQ